MANDFDAMMRNLSNITKNAAQLAPKKKTPEEALAEQFSAPATSGMGLIDGQGAGGMQGFDMSWLSNLLKSPKVEAAELPVQPEIAPQEAEKVIPQVNEIASRTQAMMPSGMSFKASIPLLKPTTPKEEAEAELTSEGALPQLSTDDSELAEAQQKRDDLRQKLLILQGATQIGTSLASGGVAQASPEVFQQAAKNAEDVVADVKARQDKRMSDLKEKLTTLGAGEEQAKADPNSAISKAYRENLKSLGDTAGVAFKIPQNASANDLEKIAPQLFNIVNAKQAQDARSANLQIAASERSNRMLAKQGEDNFERERKLRGEIVKADDKWGITRGESALGAIRKMMMSKENPGLADITMMYNYIKSIDPTSVVREAEVKLLEQAQSIMKKAINTPAMLTKGQIFDPSFRQSLMQAIESIHETNKQGFNKDIKATSNTIKSYGLNPENILREELGVSTETAKAKQDTNKPQTKQQVESLLSSGQAVKLVEIASGRSVAVPANRKAEYLASGKYKE